MEAVNLGYLQNNYLNKNGDTMNGQLKLTQSPSDNQDAINLGYLETYTENDLKCVSKNEYQINLSVQAGIAGEQSMIIPLNLNSFIFSIFYIKIDSFTTNSSGTDWIFLQDPDYSSSSSNQLNISIINSNNYNNILQLLCLWVNYNNQNSLYVLYNYDSSSNKLNGFIRNINSGIKVGLTHNNYTTTTTSVFGSFIIKNYKIK